MSRILTFRLTPEREKRLNTIKKRFKVKKNSEAIDLLLKMTFEKEPSYRNRIEKVTGCIALKGKEDAEKRIRRLRDRM